jgi:hypothetical protein
MRRGLLVALAVVAAVNLGVMFDVLRDRAGEPDAVVTLDERELALERPPRDGGAIALRWRFQREGRPGGNAPNFLPHWMDQRTLEAIGFDCPVPPGAPNAAEYYRGVMPRRVLVAFEFGGPAWKARLATWQQRSREDLPHLIATGVLKPGEEAAYRETIDRAPERVSRLVPVDVGLDAEALRARHPDRGRYLLLPALVRLFRDEGAGGAGPTLVGHVVEVLPGELPVPREAHDVLAGLGPTVSSLPPRSTTPRSPGRYSVERIADAPRYSVRVQFGRLLRPRITSVARVDAAR